MRVVTHPHTCHNCVKISEMTMMKRIVKEACRSLSVMSPGALLENSEVLVSFNYTLQPVNVTVLRDNMFCVIAT